MDLLMLKNFNGLYKISVLSCSVRICAIKVATQKFNLLMKIIDMQDTLPPMDPVFPAPESKLPHSKPKCGSFSKATKRALSQLFKNSKEMI